MVSAGGYALRLLRDPLQAEDESVRNADIRPDRLLGVLHSASRFSLESTEILYGYQDTFGLFF